MVQLADEAGDRVAKREFKKRLHEEEQHLTLMRKVVEKLAIQDVFGKVEKLPATDLGALLS